MCHLFTMMLVAIVMVSARPLYAQDQNQVPDLDDIRAELQDELRNSHIGAGYAQMLNFFIDPSISASRLKTDDGTDYDIFKLPLQADFPLNDRGWELAVRGTLSHAEATNLFEIIPGETIDGTWKADSGQIGAGLIIPASDKLSWFLAGQFGVSRMKSEADYNGGLGEAIIAPIADGILFNWETNARIYSFTGGVDYEDTYGDHYDLGVYARYSHSYIESYSESRDLVPFDAHTGTFSAKADLKHPYGVAPLGRPLFGVAHMAVTAFTGPNRDALDFTHFYELGYSLGVEVSERSRFFRSFSIGFQANLGRDLEGYSLLFGWELK